jgi:hypothetical protein
VLFLQLPPIDPSTWRDIFSEDELDAAIKVMEAIRR